MFYCRLLLDLLGFLKKSKTFFSVFIASFANLFSNRVSIFTWHLKTTRSRWRFKRLRVVLTSTNTFKILIYYLSLVWKKIEKVKHEFLMHLLTNISLQFSKHKLHLRPSRYAYFIIALFTQPVVEYNSESLDGMPLISTLLENELPLHSL